MACHLGVLEVNILTRDDWSVRGQLNHDIWKSLRVLEIFCAYLEFKFKARGQIFTLMKRGDSEPKCVMQYTIRINER